MRFWQLSPFLTYPGVILILGTIFMSVCVQYEGTLPLKKKVRVTSYKYICSKQSEQWCECDPRAYSYHLLLSPSLQCSGGHQLYFRWCQHNYIFMHFRVKKPSHSRSTKQNLLGRHPHPPQRRPQLLRAT